MSLNASNFQKEPTLAHTGKLKGFDSTKTTVIDSSIQGVFQTEPLYAVGDESIKGILNFKMYDQYSGHVVNNDYDPNVSGTTYTIQESGKVYQSGKVYYLGFKTIALPAY
jgi:hypothetical protein